MLKRGLLPSQGIIYILGIIIIVLIFLLGYKTINDINKSGKETELITLKTQMQSNVNSLKNDYGTEMIKEHPAPIGFDEICFVDLKQVNPNLLVNRTIIKSSVEKGIEKNVFLSSQDNYESFYISGLSLPFPYFSCTQLLNKEMELKMKGERDAALVRAPPNRDYCEKAQQDNLCDALDIIDSGYKAACCKEFSLCC